MRLMQVRFYAQSEYLIRVIVPDKWIFASNPKSILEIEARGKSAGKITTTATVPL